MASGPELGMRAGARSDGGGLTPGKRRASTSFEDGVAGTMTSGGAEVVMTVEGKCLGSLVYMYMALSRRRAAGRSIRS